MLIFLKNITEFVRLMTFFFFTVSIFQRYITSLTPDEALAYAKREIENAPLVTDDQDLYTPLFKNVSTFKR